MTPLVSILIPARNAAQWIEATIQSALSQTWSRKEIIVVDDGSSDATFAIATRYASAGLKVIRQDSGGAAYARNVALRACQGDYVQWLDADDLLAHDKIANQLTPSDRRSDPCVLISSSWAPFYQRPGFATFRKTILWRDLDPVEWIVLRLSNACPMVLPTWLVSRALIERAGGWNEALTTNDDGEYSCRTVSRCTYVEFVHNARSYYRIGNYSSLSHEKSRGACESQCLSIELEIGHALNLATDIRMTTACVARLNVGAAILEADAPDLADRLRRRIVELGGSAIAPARSRRYSCVRAILGETNTQRLKTTVPQAVGSVRSCIERSLNVWLGPGGM
jgi:glycosyltransferase involved in cell wall biosynthesis